jgi:hypothetical protein
MRDQPQTKSPRATRRGYKPPYGRDKNRDRKHRPAADVKPEAKHVASLKEISDKTLKELGVLGIQKFGSSPFSEHFDRWLANIDEVLSEFELNPNVNADEEFVKERSQILSAVKVELEERQRKEDSIDNAAKNLSTNKNLLERINAEYAVKMREIKTQKNREIKRLNSNIDRLKEELEHIIRIKTGIFRGVSKKEREEKEQAISQELDAREMELELAMLKFSEAQGKVREDYVGRKEPVVEMVRDWQKKIEVLETDGSREDRWFACEALMDAVNAFLERRALQSRKPV